MRRQTKTLSLKTCILLLVISVLTVLISTSCLQNIGYVVTGRVTQVISGDSFYFITPANTRILGRLYGIDAPETYRISARNDAIITVNQSYGEESLRALESKILGKVVHLGVINMDRHYRLVGVIWLNGRDINLEMVREGHAEVFIESVKPPYRSKFLKAEKEAKSAGRGIWSLPGYERPKDFRKRLKITDEEE